MPYHVATLHSHDETDPSNQFANVFGFFTTLPVETQLEFDEFCVDWWTHVNPYLINVTSENIRYDGWTLRPADGASLGFEYAYTPPYGGAAPGEVLPRFVTWSLLYKRAFVGQRSGHKRFSGITEAMQSNGIPVSGTLTNLQNLATKLGQPVVSVQDWVPKILHRTSAIGVSPITYTGHDVSAVTYQRITTQNSRKR